MSGETSFADRFLALARLRSPLTVGLDPSPELLEAWGLPENAQGAEDLCRGVLDAVGEAVAVFKPQAAFFEAFGPAGMAALARVGETVRACGALNLIDAKRGDVATTMAGYARAMLGRDSGFGGDAMTATPWLGLAALAPLFERARATSSAVFVVVRASNPEAEAVQTARLADGRTAAEAIADEITAANGDAQAIGPIGAVVGATLGAKAARAILDRLPRSLILAPGVGAQGASLDDVARRFGPAAARTLPSISRAILARGPDRASLREAVVRARDEAWRLAGRVEGERPVKVAARQP